MNVAEINKQSKKKNRDENRDDYYYGREVGNPIGHLAGGLGRLGKEGFDLNRERLDWSEPDKVKA